MYPKEYFSDPARVQPGSCFVLMPFAEEMRPVYDAIAEALESSEAAFTCQRADELFGGGHIINDILEGIASAELIIADVTFRNPNVFYELGIAHTTKSIEKVVILTQSMEDVPFDLRQFRCVVYQPTQEGFRRLTRTLVETVKSISAGIFRFSVIDGEPYLFPNKLLGDENFLYDFEIVSYSGYSSAKFSLDIRRHSTNRQNELIYHDTFALPVEGSLAIPRLPWQLHLDRTGAGRSHFSVRENPKDGRGRNSRPTETRPKRAPISSDVEAVRSVSFQDCVVRELGTGSIEVLRGGISIIPVKPVLRELALALNVDLLNASGNSRNTRQLGSEVIKAIQGLKRG